MTLPEYACSANQRRVTTKQEPQSGVVFHTFEHPPQSYGSEEPLAMSSTLDASEARAAALATELTALRKQLAERTEELATEAHNHAVTATELEALRNFQRMLDEQDGQDRASRANLLRKINQLQEQIAQDKKMKEFLVDVAERAKSGMYGLRAQLNAASDTIDGARRDNAALIKPYKDEIASLEAAAEEAAATLAASRGETEAALAAMRAAEAARDEALAGAKAEAAQAAGAYANQAEAESKFAALEAKLEEEVATQVANGTQELQGELDEAYDRCDVLGRQVTKLKMAIEDMERAASADKERLVQLADEVRLWGNVCARACVCVWGGLLITSHARRRRRRRSRRRRNNCQVLACASGRATCGARDREWAAHVSLHRLHRPPPELASKRNLSYLRNRDACGAVLSLPCKHAPR